MTGEQPERTAKKSATVEIPAITCRTKDKLRIGALALSQDDADAARRVTLDELEGYLKSGLPESQADIILCSAFVLTGVSASDGATVAAKVVAAAMRPVLLEWEVRGNANTWFMATGQGLFTIRHDQYIKEVKEIRPRSKEVLRELAQGRGRIEVRNHRDLDRLVLFICNEAKLLSAFRLKKIWKDETDEAKKELDEALARVMDRRWALLHPAHRPYVGYAARSGGDLVLPKTYRRREGGEVVESTEYAARLQSIIDQPLAFGRDLVGPKYVLHAGSFRQTAADRDVSTVMFTARGRRKATLWTEAAGDVEIRYAEFEV